MGEERTWIGLIGAWCGGAWFLARDVAAGHPLRTPSVLGQVLLMGKSTPNVDQLDFTGIILYTAAHVFVFLLRHGGRAPHSLVGENHFVRYALLQVFLAFELFFCVVLLVFREETRSLFPLRACSLPTPSRRRHRDLSLAASPDLARIHPADAPRRRTGALRAPHPSSVPVSFPALRSLRGRLRHLVRCIASSP